MYSTRAGFADLPVSLKFSNTSGGSSTVFKSGESWLVEITGPSNQPVWLVANGLDPIQMGSTDDNGRFVKTGTVGDGEIGNWSELWYVGASTLVGLYAGSVTFSVIAAPAPVTSSPRSTSTNPVPVASPVPMPATSSFDIGSIPIWGWLAGGAAALFLLKGKH